MIKSLGITSIILLFLFSSNLLAQQNEKLTYFVGIGPTIDGNIGLWGINFSNELSFKLGNRGSFNPSLTYYQSISSFDQFEDPNFRKDNSSGLFTNATFGYNLLRTKNNFKISLAIGPSFQLGSENTLSSANFNQNDIFPDYRYNVEKFNRLGIIQQILFDWPSKNENRVNSAMISMTSFEGYWPWYLMATYRVGFKLR